MSSMWCKTQFRWPHITMYILTEHKNESQTIICIVDQEIHGKIFTEGDSQLDLTANFFKGVPGGEIEVKEKIRIANSIHAIGENTIQLLLKEKIITEKDIKKIDSIPHTIVVQY